MAGVCEFNSDFSLKRKKGEYTVLYFYPKDNTPGCTREAQDFTAKASQFKKLAAIVIGVSKDSTASHDKFIGKHGLKVDLVSDPRGELCDRFDVIKMKSMYGRKFKGIERSTFVLDHAGKVLKEWRKVKVDGHADDVLAYLKTL